MESSSSLLRGLLLADTNSFRASFQGSHSHTLRILPFESQSFLVGLCIVWMLMVNVALDVSEGAAAVFNRADTVRSLPLLSGAVSFRGRMSPLLGLELLSFSGYFPLLLLPPLPLLVKLGL